VEPLDGPIETPPMIGARPASYQSRCDFPRNAEVDGGVHRA
jgi:hypothetical protein